MNLNRLLKFSKMRAAGQFLGAAYFLAKGLCLNKRKIEEIWSRSCVCRDSIEQIAPPDSPYQKRLDRVMANAGCAGGHSLELKAYITTEIQAYAYGTGAIRVSSALMDLLNDDELRFVLAHEAGHVAHGDLFREMRAIYLLKAIQAASGAINLLAAIIADSPLGNGIAYFFNAIYKRGHETRADRYGMEFLKRHGHNTEAAASALRKISRAASCGGGIFSTHPHLKTRLARLAKLGGMREKPEFAPACA